MKLIEELKARGLVEALTDPGIEQALEKPMTIYCGFDPSARSLQAGNLVSIIVLRRFQQAGHKVIALVGGATGLIGDPSGKSAERNMLTVAQVEENKKGIRENLSRILDFDGPNAATMVDNYDWYKGTSAIEFLRAADAGEGIGEEAPGSLRRSSHVYGILLSNPAGQRLSPPL